MDPTEHTGPVIDSGAEIQQTRSTHTVKPTVHGWMVDTCDGTGSGASPRPSSGITWPRQGISLDIGEASGGPSGPIALDDLTDVDTQTTPPTDGQALVWDTQTQLWKPGTVAGGGGGTFRIQDAEDFELNDDNPQPFYQYTLQLAAIDATGQAYPFNTGGQTHFNLSTADANGLDIRDEIASGATLWIVIEDATPLVFVSDFRANGGSGSSAFVQYRAEEPEFDLSGYAGGETVKIYSEVPTTSPKLPLADGDILRWDDAENAFMPSTLKLDDLDNVTYKQPSYSNDDESKPYSQLKIADLGSIWWGAYTVPEAEYWGLYANLTYGPTFGRYHKEVADGGTITDERTRDNAARRTYYGTNGILHNLGDKPMWLNGALGNWTDNTPELRWTSGNPQGSGAAGNYIGLKLPADISVDTTYTFPPAPADGLFLRTGLDGTLQWSNPMQYGSPLIKLTPGFVFNFEEDGKDTPLTGGNPPPAFSTDAIAGAQSLQLNTEQADAEYLLGDWPASEFAQGDYIGTRAFTFQTWVKNLSPDLAALTRYHRMIATKGPGSESNQANGFQIRTSVQDPTADIGGVKGAWELHTDIQVIRGNTAVVDNDWHHLAVQHDGKGRYTMFLDGLVDNYVDRGEDGIVNFTNQSGFLIGARGDFAENTFFQGRLDCMEILVGIAKYPSTGFTPPTGPAGEPVVIQAQTFEEVASINDLDDVDTETTPPTNGQALVWDAAAEEWHPGTVAGGGGGGTTIGRATGTATAATLADAAAADLEITALGKSGMFLKVTTSHAAWVRFYADATTRAADTRTDSSVAPTRGDGVLLEIITTGAESYMVTPSVHYFQATPADGTMHVKVTNRSGAEADIQLDVEALVLEP